MCNECLEKLETPNICGVCRTQMPRPTRNRSLEDIVARCEFPCAHGCGEVALPSALLVHQANCNVRPVRCPFGRGCAAVCPQQMFQHTELHVSGTARIHNSKTIGAFKVTKPARSKSLKSRVLLSPRPASPTFKMHHFDGDGLCYRVRMSDDQDGLSVDIKFPKQDGRSAAFAHVRVFHFVKEHVFTLRIGSPMGARMTLSGMSEPLSNGGYMDDGFTNEDRGIVLFRKRAAALSSPAVDGSSAIQLHLDVEEVAAIAV